MLSSDDDALVSAGATVLEGFDGKSLPDDEALIVDALLSTATDPASEAYDGANTLYVVYEEAAAPAEVDQTHEGGGPDGDSES